VNSDAEGKTSLCQDADAEVRGKGLKKSLRRGGERRGRRETKTPTTSLSAVKIPEKTQFRQRVGGGPRGATKGEKLPRLVSNLPRAKRTVSK